ncbi:MAG: class I SAM-dependent methyltransferase [Alphaproteobacteria bacterium]
MRTSLIRGLSALLIVSLWLAGCDEWAYRQMNDPSRDAWQKPNEVVEKLAIQPGWRVADLGAGGGYFTWHLSAAVGPQGRVYAVDIDETALGMIERKIKARGVTNVVPIRAEPSDAKLPEPVDLVFSCDTYHHMQDRVAYFKSLARYLKPDGQVAILDFHPHGVFSGLLGHGTAKEEVRREMESAGYRLIADYDFIGSQHFQVFPRKDSKTAAGLALFVRASAPSRAVKSNVDFLAFQTTMN